MARVQRLAAWVLTAGSVGIAGGSEGLWSLEERGSLEISGAEIVAYDAGSGVALIAAGDTLVGADVTPAGLALRWSVGAELLTGGGFWGGGGVGGVTLNHVAVDPTGRGVAAVIAAPGSSADGVGGVVFVDVRTGRVLGEARVGYGPDSGAFTADGAWLITANEGEPTVTATGEVIDPPGSVSVVDLRGWEPGLVPPVRTLFLSSGDIRRGDGVRIHPRNRTDMALDIEPEYVVCAGGYAYVSLQENNAVAVIDYAGGRVVGVDGLGVARVDVDPSDRDGGRRWTTEVAAFAMPDQMAAWEVGSAVRLLTVEEGDDRGAWGSGVLGDAARLEDLAAAGLVGGEVVAELARRPLLGRLRVCSFSGDTDGDGLIDRPTAFGTRGVSVRDAATGRVLGRTGSAFEAAMALDGSRYNTTGGAGGWDADGRSDDRGPEPEGVAVAELEGRRLAFVGLERPGAVAILEVTEAGSLELVGVHRSAAFGRLAPEGLVFVPARASGAGVPLLLVAYERSGSVVVYEVVGPCRNDSAVP